MKRTAIILTAAAVLGVAAPAEAERRRPPKPCLRALDAAEEMGAIAAEFAGLASEAFYAAAEFDVATLEGLAAEMEEITPGLQLVVARYNKYAERCRAA